MDHPVSAHHHPDHNHDHGHHDHAHGHDAMQTSTGLSLLQSPALIRLAGALIVLIPLWIAVYWVSAS